MCISLFFLVDLLLPMPQKTKILVWLHDNADMRIEGRIVVSQDLRLANHPLFKLVALMRLIILGI